MHLKYLFVDTTGWCLELWLRCRIQAFFDLNSLKDLTAKMSGWWEIERSHGGGIQIAWVARGELFDPSFRGSDSVLICPPVDLALPSIKYNPCFQFKWYFRALQAWEYISARHWRWSKVPTFRLLSQSISCVELIDRSEPFVQFCVIHYLIKSCVSLRWYVTTRWLL